MPDRSRRVPRALALIVAILLAVGLALVKIGPREATASFTTVIDLRAPEVASSLPPYPMIYSAASDHWLEGADFRFAADGGLEHDYGNRYGNAGWLFNAVSSSQLCLSAYNESLDTNDEELRTHVVRQARALRARAVPSGKGIVWRYEFPHESLDVAAGWISGMAQAGAMACFSVAHLLTKDPSFLDAAAKAFASLTAPFGSNGTASPAGDGVFYEEVAGAGGKPAHILNGMISALAGIWMTNRIDPRPGYRTALDDGIRAVRSLIDRYVGAGISMYDLGPGNVAKLRGGYNLVHVSQLQWLYDVTGDRHFLDVAVRFLRFERRIPFDLVARRGSGAEDVVAGLQGRGGFSARPGEKIVLEARFKESTSLDRLEIVAGSDVPAEIAFVAGGVRRAVRPEGRLITIRFPLRRVDRATIELIPRPGRPVTLAVLTFSDPTLRSLTALSSDVHAYWDRLGDGIGSERSTLNLYDDDTRTVWRATTKDPWLLFDLRDAGTDRIRLTPCSGTFPSRAAFSRDLAAWTRPAPVAGDRLRIPVGARFLLLSWDGAAACLAGAAAV